MGTPRRLAGSAATLNTSTAVARGGIRPAVSGVGIAPPCTPRDLQARGCERGGQLKVDAVPC